jgi:hypothetical protein
LRAAGADTDSGARERRDHVSASTVWPMTAFSSRKLRMTLASTTREIGR